MEDNTFLCTRPKLASKLMAAGYEGRQTVNPWSPERTAWEFDKCDAMMEIVTQYTFAHEIAEDANFLYFVRRDFLKNPHGCCNAPP